MKKACCAFVLLALVSMKSFGDDWVNGPIHFVVTHKDDSSIAQIIGLCDGTHADSHFRCRLAHIFLTKGDEIHRKVQGGGPNQCYMEVASDGMALTFNRKSETAWTATSDPSPLCGQVDTYTLETDSKGVFWKLTVESKNTEATFPGCQLGPLPDSKRIYGVSVSSLACEGVALGSNPGF